MISERFHPNALSKIQADPQFKITRATEYAKPNPQELEDTDILIVRSKTQVNKNLLECAPQLKLILTTTSGFDHIDLEETKKRNIQVTHTPKSNAISASEMTWALVLSCAKKLIVAHEQVKRENWDRSLVCGTELSGKTYGIVGLGRVGKRVAQVAQAFDMSILAYDPYLSDFDFQEANATRVGLTELFKESEVVSLHVPATHETKYFISRDNLADLGPSGIFVNTSRGTTIKHVDLLNTLDEGKLGAAGLDVFETEPPSQELKLIQHPNVTLSPHIGGTTVEALNKTGFDAVEELYRFVEGKELHHQLPPDANWWQNSQAKNK